MQKVKYGKYGKIKSDHDRITVYQPSKKTENKNGIMKLDEENLVHKIFVWNTVVPDLECIKLLTSRNIKTNKFKVKMVFQYINGDKNVNEIMPKDGQPTEEKINELINKINELPIIEPQSCVVTDCSKCKTLDECLKKLKSKVNEEHN